MKIPERIEIAVTKRNSGAGAMLPDWSHRIEAGPVGVTVFVWYPRRSVFTSEAGAE